MKPQTTEKSLSLLAEGEDSCFEHRRQRWTEQRCILLVHSLVGGTPITRH